MHMMSHLCEISSLPYTLFHRAWLLHVRCLPQVHPNKGGGTCKDHRFQIHCLIPIRIPFTPMFVALNITGWIHMAILDHVIWLAFRGRPMPCMKCVSTQCQREGYARPNESLVAKDHFLLHVVDSPINSQSLLMIHHVIEALEYVSRVKTIPQTSSTQGICSQVIFELKVESATKIWHWSNPFLASHVSPRIALAALLPI